MNTKLTHIGFVLLILAVAIVGLVAYPYLPERVVSHWNSAGVADGYMSRFWGVLMFPLLLAGLYGLYGLALKVDPMKANIQAFRKQYNLFFFAVNVFMAYIFGLFIAWNLGWQFSFGAAILPAGAVFLWFMGVLMSHAKRNWFVGIRTPWTLSSDKVWNTTHRLGGRLFKVSAVIALAGLFFGEFGFWFFILPLFASVLATVVYSYVVYAKK